MSRKGIKAKPKPAQLESSVESEDSEMEELEQPEEQVDESQVEMDPIEEEEVSQESEHEQNVSHAYDDEDEENSPDVANVAPVAPKPSKGTKRKPLLQQVVEGRQTRKKQKSPPRVTSIFDSEVESDAGPESTSTPAAPAAPAAPAVEIPSKKTRPPRAVSKTMFSGHPGPVSDEAEQAAPKKRTKAVHIKLPVHLKFPPMKVMLQQAMEELNDPRKGISVMDVKHFLHTTFNYTKQPAINKAIKSRIESGEYVKTTGIGLNGKFKLPVKKPEKKEKKETVPKPRAVKKPAKKAEPEPSTSKEAASKGRKGTKTVAAMTEVKKDKRRRSLKLEAPKTPKVAKGKKGDSAKNAKEEAKAKATKKASSVAKMQVATGKVKSARPKRN